MTTSPVQIKKPKFQVVQQTPRIVSAQSLQQPARPSNSQPQQQQKRPNDESNDLKSKCKVQ